MRENANLCTVFIVLNMVMLCPVLNGVRNSKQDFSKVVSTLSQRRKKPRGVRGHALPEKL